MLCIGDSLSLKIISLNGAVFFYSDRTLVGVEIRDIEEPFSTVIEAPSELSVEALKGFWLITISESFSAVRAERLESTEEMNFPVEERTNSEF